MKKCSGLNQERNLHRSQNSSKEISGGFWCERRQKMHFFTGNSIIMDSYFSENVLMLDLFQFLSSPDELECCGLLWCFYQTLILTAPIHCSASVAETLMRRHIYTNLMKKQTHLHLGWPESEHIFSKYNFLGELFIKHCFHSEHNYLHVSIKDAYV